MVAAMTTITVEIGEGGENEEIAGGVTGIGSGRSPLPNERAA